MNGYRDVDVHEIELDAEDARGLLGHFQSAVSRLVPHASDQLWELLLQRVTDDG